jgi:hypothetical protein
MLGKVPFGFRVGQDGRLVGDIAEQAIIVRIQQMRAAGHSFQANQSKVAVDGYSYPWTLCTGS